MTFHPHVLPLIQRLPGAIFQLDSARPHTARLSQDNLRTLTTIPWPARSPDLSPIEHIWVHLGRRVRQPTSLSDYSKYRTKCLKTSYRTYASMPVRIASCIRARWGSTGY
ncbi:transposable element Tcb1 transposase [Trichonephila clavipes]|nr:transposable element Tcb1 transposase [Trichonephila clavipes]